jgi:hypothetical protein
LGRSHCVAPGSGSVLKTKPVAVPLWQPSSDSEEQTLLYHLLCCTPLSGVWLPGLCAVYAVLLYTTYCVLVLYVLLYLCLLCTIVCYYVLCPLLMKRVSLCASCVLSALYNIVLRPVLHTIHFFTIL